MNFIRYSIVVDDCLYTAPQLKELLVCMLPALEECKDKFEVGCGYYDLERVITTADLGMVTLITKALINAKKEGV
jgi:hypothetical protein